MEKLTLYRNKPEIFQCELQIEGADLDDTVVKLCLEFEDNKNVYFYGELNKDGICSISIPKLTEISKNSCKLIIEAIADSTYFKVYEANVELKNSVEVKIKANSFGGQKVKNETTVKMGRILREEETTVNKIKEDPIEQSTNEASSEKLKSYRDWKRENFG